MSMFIKNVQYLIFSEWIVTDFHGTGGEFVIKF